MKKIKSRFLGEVEVDENKVLDLGGSIIGFENYNYFYLLDNNTDPNSLFKILQSAENEDLYWIVLDPFMLFADYDLEVHDEDIIPLSIEDKKDVAALVIITVINGDYQNMTANLLAPIIINFKNNKAKQCIVKSDKYCTKHRLFKEKVAQ